MRKYLIVILLFIIGGGVYGLIEYLFNKVGASTLVMIFISGGFIFGALFAYQKRILDIIALCIGICLLTVSGFLYFNTQSFIKDSFLTEGIVIEYERIESGDDTIYYPVIEFETEDRNIIHIFKDHYYQLPSIGDEVKVIYNPENPSDARINTWLTLWSWPVVTFCFGAFATIFATLRLLKYRFKTKRQNDTFQYKLM